METTTRLILPEVVEALRSNPQELLPLTEELHPADLADLAAALELELAQKLVAVLPIEIGARLLENCEAEWRGELFAGIAEASLDAATALTDEMAPDDRADLYATLTDELRVKLLAKLDDEESRDIRQLLSYADDTAGALLTTDFVALPADATAAQAIDLVRQIAEEMETIYQAYAVDPHGTLLGVVSLRDLVTSPAERSVDEIMNPNIVTAAVDADQEEVARLIAKYDLLALPVVDPAHRILGIITVDDAIDVVEEEATEDVQKLGAVEPLEGAYLTAPVRELIKARAPWMIALFVAVLATRNVLEHYTGAELVHLTILMWFVPLIASAGGNSGSQSATLVIRALALGKLEPRDAGRVLTREIFVGVTLGLIVSVVGVASVLVWDSTRMVGMVLTMFIAVVAVVTVGALLGTGVPLLLEKLGIDPAVSSTPFIASIVDIAGLVIYFEIGTLFLG